LESIQHNPDHLISKLSSSFNNVTNTYKHYWLWSIIELLYEDPKLKYSLHEIGLKMIELVWHPLTFYKLSFGKQDSFVNVAKELTINVDVESYNGNSSY